MRAAIATTQGRTEAPNKDNTPSVILIWTYYSMLSKKTSANLRFHSRKSCVTLWKTQASAAVINLAAVITSLMLAPIPAAIPVQTSQATCQVLTPSHLSKPAVIIFENLRNIFWSDDLKTKDKWNAWRNVKSLTTPDLLPTSVFSDFKLIKQNFHNLKPIYQL